MRTSTIDRIRDIARQGRERARYPPPGGPPRRELSYEPVDAQGMPVESVAPAGALEGASLVRLPSGSCLVVERRFDPDERYGPRLVRDLEPRDEASLGLLGGWSHEDAPSPPRSRLVFLDLETTGLNGGAGTVAFLIGCGYFDDRAFHTRQYFLTSFSGERALLEAAGECLADAGTLVTYNGKCFDMPVMETRWLFQRMGPVVQQVRHLDMLHLARRLWRIRGVIDDGCRLVELEHRLLGFARVGDVPGWEIPSRYFDFVRRGDPAPLEPVLQHNRLDLLSLAAVTRRAQDLVGGDGLAGDATPEECLGVGLFHLRRGAHAHAERCFEQVIASPTAGAAARAEAHRSLARILRRRRRFHEAARAWSGALHCAAGDSTVAAEAREALAVHHEHRRRDLAAARALAAHMLAAESTPARRRRILHRLARIERKLGVERERGDPKAASLLDD